MATPRRCETCDAVCAEVAVFCAACGTPLDGDEPVKVIDLGAPAGRTSAPSSSVEPRGPDGAADDRPRRGRLVRWLGLVVALGVVAWTVAALALSDGDGGGGEPVPDDRDAADAEATPAPDGDGAVGEVLPPSGGDDGATATATAPGPDLSVVVASRAGVDLIDLATGARRTVVDVGTLGTATPVGLAGRWLVARDGAETVALALDTGEQVAVAPSDELIVWSTDAATVWRVEEPDDLHPQRRAQLVDLDGSDPALTVRLPPLTRVVGATGTGVVVEGPGGVFFVDRRGAVEVVDGTVRAVAGDTVLYWGCDRDLECGTALADLVTGESAETTFDIGPVPRLAVVTLAPDGGAISYYAFSNSGPLSFEVVELPDAVRTIIYEHGVSPFPTAWSGDGRWFLYTVDARLTVHDRRSETVTHTAIEVPVGNNVGLYVVGEGVGLAASP